MLSDREMFFGIILPAIVSLLIGAIGAWRRWPWAAPLAVGVGFLAGYGVMAHPKLPPADGTEWLFWTAIPVVLLAAGMAFGAERWMPILGAWGGVVGFAVLRPLHPQITQLLLVSAGLAVWGVAAVCAGGLLAKRAGNAWGTAVLVIALGAAAVTVLSSNLRTTGVYGLGAATAVGPLVVLARWLPGGGAVWAVAVSLLAGVVVGGTFYPEPGLSATQIVALLGAPLLVLPAAFIPANRRWIRGLAAVLAVAILTAAIAAPAARAAKKAAEEDPYSSYQ